MKKCSSFKLLAVFLGLILFSFALTACGGSNGTDSGDGDKVTKLNAAFLGQIDAWPIYTATMDGTDEKYGLDIEMMFFDSGMPMIETLPAKQWQIADAGSVPSLMASLRYDVEMVGIASDESPANAVMARADNAVFKTQGSNPDFPKAFGSADDVRGKTFLVTTVSSGHYTLSKYLEALGLTEKDVVINNLEQAQAIKAFESGEGDFLVLWTPYMYRAFEKGWKTVADASQVGATTLMMFLAEKDFAAEHPELVAQFLAANNEKTKRYLSEGVALVPEIQTYYKDWAAMDISESDVKLDIETHKLYTIEEQIAMMESGELEASLTDAANFFVNQNKFKPEEFDQLKAKKFGINPAYLKAALEVKPAE
ncbi:ABC transporter substrate-binding protein [Dehalobacterium formicoaceticum]|uniref:ABC transporter substrate-binding protein n=1 Tax=Dehalobacterium formicoaceticum TaxID=51515 RepID=A0ABT1Y1C0_9FIRM|nr:ABC transporter substrate-binding protein [Dehalobacterium formicoaceticum]MCR6544662.1 ABC transporter substrate-binding protein [Dehalobacterium formicoaceticum]